MSVWGRVAVLLLASQLAGCVSREERQSREQAEDHRTCLSMGVDYGNPRYLDCRHMMMQRRAYEGEVAQARYRSMMGAGLGMMALGQPVYAPAPPTFTCIQTGNVVTCR